jgi:hypothetical protein
MIFFQNRVQRNRTRVALPNLEPVIFGFPFLENYFCRFLNKNFDKILKKELNFSCHNTLKINELD